MTRKKSNVKALALAVTCAILAGGYSALNPVYAAVDLYRDNSTGTVTAEKADATIIDKSQIFEITSGLTIGGVKVGGKDAASGVLEVKEILGIRNSGSVSDVKINGATFASEGAITASSLKLGDVNVSENLTTLSGNIETNKNNINALQTTVGNDSSGLVKDVSDNKTDISNLKTTVGDADSGLVKDTNILKQIVGDVNSSGLAFNTQKISYNRDSKFTQVNGALKIVGVDDSLATLTLEQGSTTGSINAEKLNAVDGAVTVSNGSTLINAKLKGGYDSKIGDVKFEKDGKISGVQDINNGFLKIQQDSDGNDTSLQVSGDLQVGTINAKEGSTIGKVEFTDKGILANKNETNQVQINEEGIVVGKNSTVIGSDGVYAGGHTEATAKAVLSADGSIKGAGDGTGNYKFTVDGTTGNVTTAGDIQGKDIIATGALKGSSLEVTGNATVGGTLGVTGVTTLSSTLEVTGKTTLKDNLEVAKDATVTGALSAASGKFTVNGTTGLATFGDDAGNQSTIAGKTATFGKDTGDQTVITGGVITAKSLKVDAFATKSITADDEIKVGTNVSLNKDGVLDLGANTLTDDQLGNINNTIKAGQVIEAKSGSIGGVKFSPTGEVSDVKNVTAEKGTIGQVGLEGGKVTAANGGTIGGVNFATGGKISDVTEITATAIKDGAGTIITGGKVESKTAKIGAISIDNETIEGSTANGLKIEGVQINDGVVSGVKSLTADTATIGGVNKLDNTGITVDTGKKIQVGTNTIIEDGKLAVSTNTNLTDQSLIINATNTWTQAGGLVADKASVNGVVLGADATKGKATFTDAGGKVTTISGDIITTGTITADELLVDKISLGKDPSNKNITIGSNGDVETKGDITVTGTDGDTTVIDGSKATFGKNADNQTIIEKGNITATAHDATTHQQSKLTHNEKGFTVAGQDSASNQSSFEFSTQTGTGTFTDKDNTTTTINGSTIISTAGDSTTGKLVGNQLELKKDGNNVISFKDSVGTFTKDGKTTTISGDEITTKTLNVDVINLGEGIYDTNGTPVGGNLSMDKQGNFSAASGNFTVTGGTGTNRGALSNKVGNTSFNTSENGASMSYDKTATAGGVKSEVSVGNDSAKISSGASSIEVKNDGITNNGKTTFTGANYDPNATTPGTTTIDGNTITTGKLITDQLVIKGSGNTTTTKPDGTIVGEDGSIAFGGNGTITSNIKEGSKETTFDTKVDGVRTTVTDGTTTTENKVEAAGNTNTVTKGTDKSEFKQTSTSIGGVVTNGKVSMKQELTTDGLKISDEKGDAANYTQITDKDVSITDQKNAGKRINLSDLGQLGDLNEEITSREEYTNNKTAVGAINSVSGRLTDEVNRLDGRINDVSDRVNKVGAMAAAIASLKSIGYDPQAPSEFSIGLGQYKGETGVAMGFFHYPNKNFMINVSLSTAGGETMGGIGATWRFGHKSPQKLLDEQRAAQAKKELAAAEKYQAAAKLAKEAQERAEYAAKLARQAQVSADNAKAAADATQAKHFQ